jgi:hypothetical protein
MTAKQIGGIVVAAIVIFAVGFGTGKFTTPTKVVVDEKKVEELAIKLAQTKVETIIAQRIEEYKIFHKEEFTKTKWKNVRVAVPCPAGPPPADGCKPPCGVDCSTCPKQIIEINSGSTNTGTNTTDTTGKDTTNTNTNTNTNTVITDNSKTSTEKRTETTYDKPQWLFSGKLGADFNSINSKTLGQSLVYGGEIDKRLAGPIWVGVWGYSNLTFGLSLGLEL